MMGGKAELEYLGFSVTFTAEDVTLALDHPVARFNSEHAKLGGRYQCALNFLRFKRLLPLVRSYPGKLVACPPDNPIVVANTLQKFKHDFENSKMSEGKKKLVGWLRDVHVYPITPIHSRNY